MLVINDLSFANKLISKINYKFIKFLMFEKTFNPKKE